MPATVERPRRRTILSRAPAWPRGPTLVSASSGDPAEAPTEVRLRDLRPTEAPVVIIGRVISAQRRQVTRRSGGGTLPVLSGLLSDGTATVRFTWWDPPSEEIERGTVLRAGPVQVREFRGRPEVSFTWRTRVAPASESELPVLNAGDLELRTIATLSDGDEGIRLEARVGRVEARSVTVGEERRQLHEGLLFDASGSVAFTAWTDFSLREGEAVRILGGYVRAFRGRPRLTLDERSHVERIPATGLPSLAEWKTATPQSVAVVEAAHGGESVALEGVVVALVPPSGIVYRCPQCQRPVSQGLCRVHGAVAGVPDLRSRLALDDGTGSATVNLERPDTERLAGLSLSEALDRLRATPDPTLIEERIFEATFGRRLRVRGRVVVDDFGATVYPDAIEPVPRVPTTGAVELRTRLERRAP